MDWNYATNDTEQKVRGPNNEAINYGRVINEQFLDGLNTCAVSIHNKGEILFANRFFAKLLGFTEIHDIIGKTLFDFRPNQNNLNEFDSYVVSLVMLCVVSI